MNDLLAKRLATLARDGRTATYRDLAQTTRLRMGELTAALEALMEADAGAGRPFLAAVCEARLTPGLPARGFFEKARALGRFPPDMDPVAFVAAERDRLRAATLS